MAVFSDPSTVCGELVRSPQKISHHDCWCVSQWPAVCWSSWQGLRECRQSQRSFQSCLSVSRTPCQVIFAVWKMVGINRSVILLVASYVVAWYGCPILLWIYLSTLYICLFVCNYLSFYMLMYLAFYGSQWWLVIEVLWSVWVKQDIKGTTLHIERLKEMLKFVNTWKD